MAPKTCQKPNQSLIYDLFNQILNCNFDFQINSIASLPNSIAGPKVGRIFSNWSLILNLSIGPSIDQ
jgi:hypothetical protein